MLFRIEECFDQREIAAVYKAWIVYGGKYKLRKKTPDQKDQDQNNTEFIDLMDSWAFSMKYPEVTKQYKDQGDCDECKKKLVDLLYDLKHVKTSFLSIVNYRVFPKSANYQS